MRVRDFPKLLTVRNIALLFLFVSISAGLVGYIDQHGGLWRPNPFVGDFYANMAAELASIAITVLIIDTLNDRRVTALEKQKLIFQMGSPINSTSREAIRELRQRGWLQNGALRGASLAWSNLKDANIRRADLREIDFTGVLIEGTHLQKSILDGSKGLGPEQFVQLRYLVGAILPDGTRYDGRYRLPVELDWVRRETDIDIEDPQQMAAFYIVPLDIYLAGQQWADENLEALREKVKCEKQRQAKLARIGKTDETLNSNENAGTPIQNPQFLQPGQYVWKLIVLALVLLTFIKILVERYLRKKA